MFKSLKEKLKNWTEKVVKEVTSKEEPQKGEEKKAKKPEKKAPKEKKEKKTSKKKETISKKEKKLKDKEEKKSKKENEIKEEIIETELPVEKEKKSKRNFFQKKLTEEKFEELFEELSLTLLQNNVAFSVVEKIKEELKEKLVGENMKSMSLEDSLTETIENLLIEPPNFLKEIKKSLREKSPYVILFAGINGSGKTTTIARIARLLKEEKISVCLAAADTFRSAAIEQLGKHADNLGVPIIKKEYNSDPASVGFEAVSYAKKNKIDVVLIDTAGRMNSSETLMREIEKISRVSSPDLKIFVGESITGNDATNQAESFNETLGLDGIILTKADIDEKAGTILSVSYVTKKPIYFLGTGQDYKDLEPFTKKKILGRIFS